MALHHSMRDTSPASQPDKGGPTTLPKEDEELTPPNDPEIDDEDLDMDDDDDTTDGDEDDPNAV